MGKVTSETTTKTLKVKVAVEQTEGERTITAVVSSSNQDRDYEYVDVPSLRLPLKGGGYVVAKELSGNEPIDIPMLINHSFDVEDVIGSVRKAYLNEAQELVVVFGVSGRAKAQDLMMLIDEQHLDNAFSITMNDYQYDWENETISDAEIVEISLVFRGSNKDARILAVKSLLNKETGMSKAPELSLEDKKKQLEALQKEIDAAEAPAPEAPVETPTPAPEAPKEEPKPVATPAETPKEQPKTEETTVETSTKVLAKQVKDVPEVEVLDTKSKKINKKEVRELFVKQFIAARTGDKQGLAELNEKVMELRGVKEKAITYANGEALYQDEIVSNDILEQYTQYGNVGQLVNRIDILGAERWKRPVETDGNGFTPVGLQGTKDEDKPVWTSLTVTPHEHALIVAWYDAIARRTPVAVYNQIIRYIAKMYAKLEDTIILTFEGGTFDGETYESTGLFPALEADNRVVEVVGYDSESIVTALGEAYGLVESDGTPTIVANRKTWGKMAVAVDGEGRTVFNVVGNQVQAGALGTFNVVVSQVAPDDKAAIGVFEDYDLVTRGELEQLFSREATVGSFNLFTQDGSAVRSNIDISGAAARLESFVELDFTATS